MRFVRFSSCRSVGLVAIIGAVVVVALLAPGAAAHATLSVRLSATKVAPGRAITVTTSATTDEQIAVSTYARRLQGACRTKQQENAFLESRGDRDAALTTYKLWQPALGFPGPQAFSDSSYYTPRLPGVYHFCAYAENNPPTADQQPTVIATATATLNVVTPTRAQRHRVCHGKGRSRRCHWVYA